MNTAFAINDNIDTIFISFDGQHYKNVIRYTRENVNDCNVS